MHNKTTRRLALVAALTVVVLLLVAFLDRGYEIGTPGEARASLPAYVAEFKSSQLEGSDAGASPDGSATLEWEGHYSLRIPFCDDCHTLWLLFADGSRRKVITAVEGDPCSGKSFEASWSADSKAVFLKGWYSGLGCHWVEPYDDGNEMALIYTIRDGRLWAVPRS